MHEQPVILIGIEEFDNLGIGYLASVLVNAGYDAKIIDFRTDKKEILEKLLKLNPKIVGFSVVYENYIGRFAELVNYLRKAGINCHFTAGGHYASLRHEEIFKFIPSLDSVVRFEGEYTFLELVNSVFSGREWRRIKGLAHKSNRKVLTNSLRPPEKDLDTFPFPMRLLPLKEYTFEKKFAAMLAGRGCIYDCSYCSTREFYQQASGPIKRIRKPEMVVKEMALLYHEQGCSVFLFQDDDFPVKTSKGSEWIEKFCESLRQNGLKGQIMWKINCRPDEIDHDSFDLMKKHGLFLVFLGIEEGTNSGLKRLNKHMTVSESLEGINILKKLGIGFDYGFMLFQPSSTFKSLNENLDFLKKICGDGYTPVTFLKVLPYYETHIEKDLRKDGRLKGEPGFLDYDFLDDALNDYYKFITSNFFEWLREPEGLTNLSKWVRNYFSVFSYFYEITPEIQFLLGNVNKIVAESNLFLLDTMKNLSMLFKSGEDNRNKNHAALMSLSTIIKQKHDLYKKQITDCLTELIDIYDTLHWMESFA
jgi:anaerobic magnesium-protoporphyrin IX monomethyl ester cyclase